MSCFGNQQIETADVDINLEEPVTTAFRDQDNFVFGKSTDSEHKSSECESNHSDGEKTGSGEGDKSFDDGQASCNAKGDASSDSEFDPKAPTSGRSRTKITTGQVPVGLVLSSQIPTELHAGPSPTKAGSEPEDNRLKLSGAEGKRLYCHICRRLIEKTYARCSQCASCFCGRCLHVRQGEDVLEVSRAKAEWVCPKCRGGCGPGCTIRCCTCSRCCCFKGVSPYGLRQVNEAQSKGFSLHAYQIHLQTGESKEMIASRMLARKLPKSERPGGRIRRRSNASLRTRRDSSRRAERSLAPIEERRNTTEGYESDQAGIKAGYVKLSNIQSGERQDYQDGPKCNLRSDILSRSNKRGRLSTLCHRIDPEAVLDEDANPKMLSAQDVRLDEEAGIKVGYVKLSNIQSGKWPANQDGPKCNRRSDILSHSSKRRRLSTLCHRIDPQAVLDELEELEANPKMFSAQDKGCASSSNDIQCMNELYKNLTDSLVVLGDMAADLYLMDLCASKKKEVLGNKMSITLSDKEVALINKIRARSSFKSMAYQFHPDRLRPSTPEERKEMKLSVSKHLRDERAAFKLRLDEMFKSEYDQIIPKSSSNVRSAVDVLASGRMASVVRTHNPATK